MSPPRHQVRAVRSVLVGVCSAIATVGAHTGAGAGLPGGGALVVALLVCAAAGAAVGAVTLDGRFDRIAGIVIALLGAQVLGHIALVCTGGHHHGDMGLSASMMLAHGAAAVVLGAVIAAVEYLYAVCATVLCWLRLFVQPSQGPPRRVSCGFRDVVVPQSFWAASGLGMRAPPVLVAATA